MPRANRHYLTGVNGTFYEADFGPQNEDLGQENSFYLGYVSSKIKELAGSDPEEGHTDS